MKGEGWGGLDGHIVVLKLYPSNDRQGEVNMNQKIKETRRRKLKRNIRGKWVDLFQLDCTLFFPSTLWKKT